MLGLGQQLPWVCSALLGQAVLPDLALLAVGEGGQVVLMVLEVGEDLRHLILVGVAVEVPVQAVVEEEDLALEEQEVQLGLLVSLVYMVGVEDQ